jgi:succinyl-CoA synthetase beta subunit
MLGLSLAHRCLLWALHIKHAPFVHRILCKECVDVADILYVASIEDRLETAVQFSSSGMDAVDLEEVLRGPLLE